MPYRSRLLTIAGLQLQVPGLWAYFAISQILPVSFSENLFFIACQLVPAEERTHETKVDPPIGYQLAASGVVMCYMQCLLAAPNTVGSPAFFPLLFATRLLLLSPLLVVWITRRHERFPGGQRRYGNVMFSRSTVTFVLAMWLLIERWSPWWPGSVKEAVDALNGNHAVSALGYDLVIGLLSLWVYDSLGYV